MKINKQKNTSVGSCEIPEQRRDGVSLPCHTAPGDISGAADDYNVNNQQQDVETTDTPLRLVDRVTALRGLSICSARDSKSTCRKRTELDLKSPDAEVPYIKTEHAIRDLVCSLIERQDRMNEKIFLKLNDLEYRVDDLELGKKSRVIRQPDIEKVVRK
jgi:hypothetical protein